VTRFGGWAVFLKNRSSQKEVATFGAIFSQTHPVTLLRGDVQVFGPSRVGWFIGQPRIVKNKKGQSIVSDLPFVASLRNTIG
jgi:hypothetical protein